MLGGLAILILSVAGYAFVARFWNAGGLPTTYRISGVCLACKGDGAVEHKAGQLSPHVCAQCKQAAVYEWMYCPKCQKRFIPRLDPSRDGRPPQMPMVPLCTGCGNARTGAYIPDDPSQPVKGDLPLPPWPPK